MVYLKMEFCSCVRLDGAMCGGVGGIAGFVAACRESQ